MRRIAGPRGARERAGRGRDFRGPRGLRNTVTRAVQRQPLASGDQKEPHPAKQASRYLCPSRNHAVASICDARGAMPAVFIPCIMFVVHCTTHEGAIQSQLWLSPPHPL